MARRVETGRVNLQEAVALLIQNQAAFVREIAETNRRHEETNRRHEDWMRRSDERFARIEQELDEIKRILLGLPEAVRQKIGFKAE